MPITPRTKKWLRIAAFAFAVYCSGWIFLEADSRQFVQVKTGLPWPEGTTHIRTFECPGIRPHFTEAFVVIPHASLSMLLQERFTRYDPTLIWKEGEPPHNYQKWTDQTKAFSDPTKPLKFFNSREKLSARHLTLGPHVYFCTGNNTGLNPFQIVVDSSNGNTWIHVTYPD